MTLPVDDSIMQTASAWRVQAVAGAYPVRDFGAGGA